MKPNFNKFRIYLEVPQIGEKYLWSGCKDEELCLAQFQRKFLEIKRDDIYTQRNT